MATSGTLPNGRKRPYREIGIGNPLVFWNRFSAALNTWDSLFLSEAGRKLKVIIFDYLQVGYFQSLFADSINMLSDIVTGRKSITCTQFSAAGWSFGGFLVSSALLNLRLVSCLILMVTNPQGEKLIALDSAFLENSLIPTNRLEDEFLLFIESNSKFILSASIASLQRIYSHESDDKNLFTQKEFSRYFNPGSSFKEDT